MYNLDKVLLFDFSFSKVLILTNFLSHSYNPFSPKCNFILDTVES